MQLTVRPTSLEEFRLIEAQIRGSYKDAGFDLDTQQSLHSYFKNKGVGDDQQFRWTYFRIYTELMWRSMSTLDEETVVNVIMARLVPMGLILDIDVWRSLMWYLSMRPLDKSEMESLYAKIRQAFFSSTAFVGKFQGRDVRVNELVDDLRKVNRTKTDSLESAEIMAKIKSLFTPVGDSLIEKYAYAPTDQIFDHFVGLVNFFLGIEPSDIWIIVDSFVNPEKYDQLAEQNARAAEEDGGEDEQMSASVATTDVTQSVSTSGAASELAPAPLATVTATAVTEEPVERLAYPDIRAMIEARFSQDKDGQFVNIDGVLSLLDSLATEMDDDRIRELYFFDEASEGFRWNDALLTT